MALFKTEFKGFFCFFNFFFFEKTPTDFYQKSRKCTATASCRLTVERSRFRRKLDLCRGQVKLWMDSRFLYICENVQSRESQCTVPKRIRSTFHVFWSAMQFFLHYLFRGSFYSVSTHRISLLTRSEKYLFLSIQEDIFCQKCQDTCWFSKIIIATYTLW